MAEYYVSSLAGGGGSGSEISPWTLAEAVAAINAGSPWNDGDTLYIKNDGKYTTSGITITNPGTTDAYSKIIGYTSIITDGGIPEIERSGGTGVLFQVTVDFWKIYNLELDGQDIGSYNLYIGAANIAKNIKCHNAGGIGIRGGNLINAHSYNNAGAGFFYTYCLNCIASNNGTQGFYFAYHAINCIGINNTLENFNLYLNTILSNCISYGGNHHGIIINGYGCQIYNTTISNVLTSKYAIYINSSCEGAEIQNVNFYNIADGSSAYCNDASQLGTYYELDPQFTDPDTLDFTRTGTNLDDKGLSQVGLQDFDYKIDIGIDQKVTYTLPDFPDESDVREGIEYDNGNKIGTYSPYAAPSNQVKINFNDGIHDYDLPHVYHLSDPIPGIKANIIDGKRGDGAISIPGGKKSVEITVRGNIFDTDGYVDIMLAIASMRTNITTDVATLTLKHYDPEGATWVNEWQYQVRRIDEITFEESLRIDIQPYEVKFLVLAY